jgi:UDP-N-acetylglucosamine 2-epimerase
MVDHVSTLHFCVTEDAVENLLKEGISDSVIFAGDLTYEFVTHLSEGLTGGFEGLPTNEYIVATFHKPDNVNSDDTLTNLVAALSDQPRPVLLITHPRLRERMKELGLTNPKGFTISPSLPYMKMISAMKGCAYLVTDSGGLHREAYYLGKRCLVRRDKGGWVRLMESGFHRYIGRDIKSIRDGIEWIERELQETHQLRNTTLIKAGSYDNVLQILVRRAAL